MDLIFGKKDSEGKSEFKKTTDSLKSLGWEFKEFNEEKRVIYFKKNGWEITLSP